MSTTRITMAQALVRHIAALRVETADGSVVPYLGGVFAIFGHGNVAGLGEALAAERDALPTYRAHTEQGMAHAAVAFAKANFRRRIMAVTTSIGPGATNLVTAAAMAHVNRLPLLMLPGDVFASRAPDPVLQQLEDFHHGDLSVNDCLRPVTRYFDRLMRPEQLLTALPRALQVMTDPANCGPVCLALPQDVQTEAFDCPTAFLQPETLRFRRLPGDAWELERAVDLLRRASKPLIVAGGGVLYSGASASLAEFSKRFGIPVAETQAGKGSLAWDHPLNLGAIGVTGSPAANEAAAQADLILAVGSRLQDFTTGSNSLFANRPVLGINVQALDAAKHHGVTVVADAQLTLQHLQQLQGQWLADPAWTTRNRQSADAWRERVTALTRAAPPQDALPYDAEVIGAVRDSAADSPRNDIVVCAAGTLPAELHKLWRAGVPGGYHMEYGYSTMGYEIAGGLGVKLACPDKEVVVMVGDGSYMMLNSEIATAVLLGRKLIVVVLDNRGYGCIHRLQRATGGEPFNNMLDDCVPEGGQASNIDFAAHARSMGAHAVHVPDVQGLRAALAESRASDRTSVLVIDTTAERHTGDGGCWWEVAVPEVSSRAEVRQARERYASAKKVQAR
ncbi:3D-(3,5/4)-trihydroxycyclohexane-1,2-dione acylhydrolase (decyclizing) [Hydrogenophaga palleronii]|uniref:3D-(3,5/4)-trihydroxycyclohexane-1,2-dione acylhydrolase (decyclizing) n=1 Tax=Hydrogenophaga palleronii TaxID=65655 RepID=UPI0008241B00|nr:3D-(3,5/4)-trihydroxycyclohexane-1,2-dione acylhydrolase (decyclizing) [Hydrogenophaga palleronii]